MKNNDIDSLIFKILDEETSSRANLLFEKKVKKGIDEKLVGKQHKIDKNKNGKIDAKDFKLLNKSEVKEKLVGKQSKIDKNKNDKIDAEDFKLLKKDKKTVKINEEQLISLIENVITKVGNDFSKKKSNTVDVPEKKNKSIKMNEEELISFIEKVISEADDNFSMKKPYTSATLDKARKKSKSEASEYIVSVGKKMNDYLKTGSNGKYNTDPEIFPKSNGELKKTDTKAFRLDDAEEEYIENLGRGPGMHNLEYDEVNPDDGWLSDNIKGSSKTGNDPKWANSGKSDVNDKLDKVRKNNFYGSEKKRAYDKSLDVNLFKTADKRPDFIKKMKESVDKKDAPLKNEFNKIQNLIKYSKKTQ